MKQMAENTVSAAAVMIKSAVLAVAVTFIVFSVFAFLVTYTSVTEDGIQTVVVTTTLISVLMAGILTGRRIQSKGWLYGMSAGVIYAAAMIITGLSFASEIHLGAKALSTLLLSAAGGGIGGMIGINISKREK